MGPPNPQSRRVCQKQEVGESSQDHSEVIEMWKEGPWKPFLRDSECSSFLDSGLLSLSLEGGPEGVDRDSHSCFPSSCADPAVGRLLTPLVALVKGPLALAPWMKVHVSRGGCCSDNAGKAAG